MNIAVAGTGYVGMSIATLLAQHNHVTAVDVIPEKYLKHIEGTSGLYEIRAAFGRNQLRIFCCFDEGKMIVLFSGFQKKTQRTPSKEIQKAIQYMNDYFDSKE